jgi:hypothetical protein
MAKRRKRRAMVLTKVQSHKGPLILTGKTAIVTAEKQRIQEERRLRQAMILMPGP